jgi:hypothetical protein
MLLLASVLVLARFRETGRASHLYTAVILLGSTLGAKFGALAFAVPWLALAAVETWKNQRPLRTALIAKACFVCFAAPPYWNAWWMTRNPVYPFLNTVFRSPYYQATSSLRDLRYMRGLSWLTPWDVTFHSSRYLESQDGGFGFQFWLLLPLALVLVRRQWPYLARAAMAIALAGCVISFSGQSYLRYIYPALPLLTIVIAQMAASVTGALYRTVSGLMIVIFALNVYFLPASGWYHKDLYLNLFRPARVDEYVKQYAPGRKLVDYLNRNNPGARVGFLDEEQVGDLRGQGFPSAWHGDRYWHVLAASSSAQDDLRAANALGITYFIAPTADSGIVLSRVYTEEFLEEFTVPEYRSGRYYVARLRDECRSGDCTPASAGRRPVTPAPPGSYDDTRRELVWSGPWNRGSFEQASYGTLTYSNHPGAELRFRFTGTAITWTYTAAWNRGRAAVTMDGKDFGRVDQYAQSIEWQAGRTFSGLSPGDHTLVVRVTGEKSPPSKDSYIDVDRLTVW